MIAFFRTPLHFLLKAGTSLISPPSQPCVLFLKFSGGNMGINFIFNYKLQLTHATNILWLVNST